MKRILVHFSGDTVQTALVEDGRLVEIIADKEDGGSIVGNIYAGVVKNIVAGPFAFVDVGLEKNAFLHLSDPKESGLYDGERLTLKAGQTILVQVTKEQAGEKGPAVTTQLSFPGKYMVLLAGKDGEACVSKKIEARGERARLKEMARRLLDDARADGAGEGLGLILRTGCQGIDASECWDELHSEFMELLALYNKVTHTGLYAKPPANLHKGGRALEKHLAAFLSRDVDAIIVDRESRLEEARRASSDAGWEVAVEPHRGQLPLFAEHGVTSQLEKALAKKVWLKSGGFIVIEQTEACVAIDVNTGKCTGARDQREAAARTNREAALEIARQLQLRNLSGMIVIDFIGMKDENEEENLVAALAEAVKADRIAVNVLGAAYLGVIMLTRKKVREPLARQLKNAESGN